MIAPSAYIAAVSWFDAKLTLGEGISIGLTLLGLAWLVVHWRVEMHRRVTPFDMRFPEGSFDRPGGLLKGKRVIHLGEQSVLVRITCRKATTFSQVNFRFYPNAKKETPASTMEIEVANVWDVEWEFYNARAVAAGDGSGCRVLNRMTSDVDTLGGHDVQIHPPIHVATDQPIWFRVVIKPKRNWDGYLSFHAEAPDGVRRPCRRRLIVDDP